ncbi:GNAT family N-acetyltransferase [Eubacteriales bacterium OttesenSCG-928-M02]|nr:GNAT family N-acetyltransferase [Eubacteriales bacterium OttesenSCG-928-M02]
MGEITYRQGTLQDVDFLVENRLAFIGVTPDEREYPLIKGNTFLYFHNGLTKRECQVLLAESEGEIVGVGVIFYYNSVPNKQNPWGKNAYITSMNVAESYRRQGIGSRILEGLMALAKEKGYSVIMLQATEMGKPLYEKYGFEKGYTRMVYREE